MAKTSRMLQELHDLVVSIDERLQRLEVEAELMRTVITIREPDSVISAAAFDGLRKQVQQASAARRTHLTQLATMSTAVRRAQQLDDLVPQVTEWLAQSGVELLWDSSQVPMEQLFESVDGTSLVDVTRVEVIEPAYVDAASGTLLRTGRARAVVDEVATPPVTQADEPDPELPQKDRPNGSTDEDMSDVTSDNEGNS